MPNQINNVRIFKKIKGRRKKSESPVLCPRDQSNPNYLRRWRKKLRRKEKDPGQQFPAQTISVKSDPIHSNPTRSNPSYFWRRTKEKERHDRSHGKGLRPGSSRESGVMGCGRDAMWESRSGEMAAWGGRGVHP
ncbi:uncharacterized protein LOC108738151 isoform X1 [Agrilus planipennis]|uniref:Uncharacterized protein LOC108738151 isoform X1 n=1 Tax=Agrilus planipennis TaxID=224129 RepID=A0A7F5R3H8_AGRPL|nr:uncharacterized protein LOC108738151 isoform X1 [Agrilus planipennis]XP_025829773.1 uncharacterized protein LOC108738151 isoform X1 [Agrilus planipennis]XP_025829779.1 uncharacterized protein LOC108738151 isoform X1 [Agrilus planipennis]